MAFQCTVFLLFAIIRIAICQFFGGSGFFGGFYGCSSYLPTLGNQCHMIAQDGSLICIGNKNISFRLWRLIAFYLAKNIEYIIIIL